ncbi:MAG: DNA-binding Lrp family transcriptional regulator [Halobacteriales archaeon]|jgi:DNA-binding Lrp family transcriptional regulator
MEYSLDEIDKRILYHFGRDARNTQATTLADEVDVTPATIRNRIDRLEETGIIRGYPADIDYERIEGRMIYLFTCTVPVPERKRLGQEVLDISGVVNVRELMSGRSNLHVSVVGEDTSDISRIAHDISELGIEIEEEHVIEREQHHPYHPFGPGDEPSGPSVTDFLSLANDAEVIEFTVSEGAAVAGLTIQAAVEAGILANRMLVVGIERDGTAVTPRGDTEFRAGDVVTLFSRDTIRKETLAAFGGVEES